MADGFIVRRGGAGGGIEWDSAIIHVYAPAGSIVTAQKSGGTAVTLQEHTVSGADSEYIHIIKKADYGTYTITATKSGEGTATETVVVNDNVEYAVRLSYDLILYDRGYTETAISGGLSHSGYAYASENMRSPTINEDNLHFAGSPNYQGIGTANKINFSGYSKLKAIIKPTNAALTAHPWLGINASKAVTTALARVFPTEANVENTVVADLSGLSVTEAYVFIFLTSSDATGYLYKLWLER